MRKIYLMVIALVLYSSIVYAIDDSNFRDAVFWYQMDGQNGTDDMSGNQSALTNSGTVYSATEDAYEWVAAENDYMEVALTYNLAAASFGCWISASASGSLPWDWRDSGTDGTQNYVDNTAEIVRVNGQAETGNLDLVDDTWHSFFYTYDSSRLIAYIDGEADINASALQGNINVNTDYVFGSIYTKDNLWYDGYMKGCWMYKRKLSTEEILYMDGKGKDWQPWNITPPPDLTPPVITPTSVTLTSAENTVVYPNIFLTDDSTFTVTMDTNEDATCAIMTNVSGPSNYNYSDMISEGGTECSTTGSTSHTCTVSGSDQSPVGKHNHFWFGCKDTALNEQSNGSFGKQIKIYTYNATSGGGTVECTSDCIKVEPGCTLILESGCTLVR